MEKIKVNKFYEKKIIIILFCLLISILGITICSKNSFLYPFNEWVDANAFFTVGKGILKGIIPYRDLFEQKGPILYFIYALGAGISYKSFIGVYLLEIVSFTFSLYYITKIINIYLHHKYIYLILPIFSSILLSSTFFACGGSAEEFALPFLSFSFYHFLNYLEKDKISNKLLIHNGIMAGIVFLIKYNLLGFWIVFIFTIFFKTILEKKYQEAFKKCFFFLIGMFIPIIIVVLYFIFNNGLKDFIYSYITINITAYSVEYSLLTRIINAWMNFYKHILQDKIILVLILIGLLYFTFDKKSTIDTKKLPILLSFIMFVFGIYIGGRNYIYYFFDIGIFIILGLISVVKIFDKFINKSVYIILLIFSLLFSYNFLFKNGNLYCMKYNKEELPQYQFSEIINKKDGATLLNYGFLDGGFYTVAGIIPNTKFFMKQNISCERFSENCLIQDSIIKNKSVDFVVTRRKLKYEKIENEDLFINYNIIAKVEHEEFIYELFEVKGD